MSCGYQAVTDQSLGLHNWSFNKRFPDNCQEPSTATHNWSNYTHSSTVPSGCQAVANWSLGLCDWGLRNGSKKHYRRVWIYSSPLQIWTEHPGLFTVLGQTDECCEKKIYKKRSCSCDQSGSLTGIVSALSTHFETFSTFERQCKYIVGYVYLIST